jgi:hypothetical protein
MKIWNDFDEICCEYQIDYWKPWQGYSNSLQAVSTT